MCGGGGAMWRACRWDEVAGFASRLICSHALEVHKETSRRSRLSNLSRALRRYLEPCADEAAGAADYFEFVGAVGEVAGVDFWSADVFDVAECGEFCSDLRWREEELEGFSGEANPEGK